jgi:hypothetical protein
MKKLKTRNEYVGCSGNARFYVDDIVATSYGWWKFVNKINGKVVFNEYNYSLTTSKHQREVKELLNTLKIKVDIVVRTKHSLDAHSFKHYALEDLYEKAIELLVANNTPRVRQSTIIKNKEEILRIKNKIKLLKKEGCIYQFKYLYRDYRHYKNKRNLREKFIKVTRGILGKKVIGKDMKIYKVIKKELRYNLVTLYDIEERKKVAVNNWTIKHKDFRKSCLLEVML